MNRLCPGAISLVVALGISSCSSIPQRNEMNWQSLSSDAIDGSLLADQIMAGRASPIFARAHAQELQDDVDQVELNVSDERLPGYEELQQVADQLSSALGDLAVNPADASVARDAKATLQELSDKIAKASS